MEKPCGEAKRRGHAARSDGRARWRGHIKKPAASDGGNDDTPSKNPLGIDWEWW
jgi:hypothetical protein